MAGRKVILATGEIYHILNRGVASQPVFVFERDYQRACNTFFYYQRKNLPLRYSHFIVQPEKRRREILKKFLVDKNLLIEIIAFCLMPNHFHFLLKQTAEGGISKFISNFANSYTRYFNTKKERSGPLFQGRFKAIRIETDEQLTHVCRYIHLNPYTSYVIKDLKDLESYPYSSFPEYLGKTKTNFCYKEDILFHFKDRQEYKKFVFDQADYQRELNNIKHLMLET